MKTPNGDWKKLTGSSVRKEKLYLAPGKPLRSCDAIWRLIVKRAGAWAVAVLCGFGEREELERAGAHMVLEQTADLGSQL